MAKCSSWQAKRFSVSKNFPAYYRNRRFIAAFASARYLSLSWASSIQSILSHPTSWRYKIHIILSSTSGSPKWSRSLTFPHKNSVHLFSPHTCYMPRHLILPNLSIRIIFGEHYISLNSSLPNFVHSSVTSSLLGLNIFLNALFANTLSLRSSLYVSDQVSHSWKTRSKLYFCISKSLNVWAANWKTQYSVPNDIKHCLISFCS
jgi:hypothetical protein